MKLRNRQIVVGVLLALLVLGVISGVIVLSRKREETSIRCECTRTQIDAIQEMVDSYAKKHDGTCPPDLAGQMPSNDDFNCFGNVKSLRDMWGKEFEYKSDGSTFLIRSAGPDMKPGTKDDITN